MGLEELQFNIKMAERQICVLETTLGELVWRQRDCGDESEFSYLETKISTISGVLHMYEAFRDKQRKLLHAETSNALREVIYNHHDDQNQSIATSDNHHHSNQRRQVLPEDDFLYLVPDLITPITDFADLMTPRLRSLRGIRFTRNIAASVLSDFNDARDI